MNDVSMNESVYLPAERPEAQKPAERHVPQIVVVEQKDDCYTPSKISLGGYAVAGVAAAAAGTSVYGRAKAALGKGIQAVEKEAGNYLKELLGTECHFKGFPNAIKVNAKYGGALATGVAATALIFKDSDKDGKFDLLEAAQKFVAPEC